MSALDDFTVALAKGGNQPQTVFDAMASLTEALIGVRLFTLMTFDPVNRLAQRIYSNMPDAYPVLGTKEVSDGLWTGRVLDRQETFVANTIEGIAEVFDDHELIQSLGCESVINVPVIVAGRILGTLNCLDVAGHYTPERVAMSEQLKLPGAACFLAHAALPYEGEN